MCISGRFFENIPEMQNATDIATEDFAMLLIKCQDFFAELQRSMTDEAPSDREVNVSELTSSDAACPCPSSYHRMSAILTIIALMMQ